MEKEFTEDSLKQFDGKDGRPVYISAAGRVVDVTGSRLWKGGRHMARHEAGRDLTVDLAAAPHGTEVLDRYPQAGSFVREPAPAPGPALPPFVTAVLARYPLLRRHPHPATVHFPIVFTASAPFFSVLNVLTGNRAFEACAFYCMIAALVFMPLGILTGFATWRINYMARPLRQVTIKRNLSFVTVLDLAAVSAWRACVPSVLDVTSISGIVYLLLVLALAPMVLIVAYYGGTLTFPVGSE